jgi:hypothetical protein
LGVVPVRELTDGIPQFVEVPIDTAMDELFLQGAVEPLHHIQYGVRS